MPAQPPPIGVDERRQRVAALRLRMAKSGVGAVLLGSTSSLRYFTGVVWRPSERFLGALIAPDAIEYIAPAFERTKVESLLTLPGELLTWEEDESPYRLIADRAAARRDDIAIAGITQVIFGSGARRRVHGVLIGEGKPALPREIGAQNIGHVRAVAFKGRIVRLMQGVCLLREAGFERRATGAADRLHKFGIGVVVRP